MGTSPAAAEEGSSRVNFAYVGSQSVDEYLATHPPAARAVGPFTLPDVIAVLLDPPRCGQAVVLEQQGKGRREFVAAFRRADGARSGLVQWRCTDRLSRPRMTVMAKDGTVRWFRGRKLTETGSGRPDYVLPALHLLFPLSAYVWGRRGDEWRMASEVRSDGMLALVRLRPMDGEGEDAHLVVDMEQELVVSYVRPYSTLTLLQFDHAAPDVRFDAL